MVQIKIGDFDVGSRPYIIAEIGNNHLGDIDLAHKTLDAAANSGVNAVKFQMFNADELVSETEPLLNHVKDPEVATQRQRFKKMELTREEFTRLYEHAKAREVDFLCTPFGLESAEFLDALVPAFKIASGDVTNTLLINDLISRGKPILISTGLCTQSEVDLLVSKLPSNRTVLLHCISSYPTPDEDVCLSLIPYYIDRYALPIGFSDHTSDLIAPIASVALGSVVIEKHFILDRALPGGDRHLSLVESEMTQLVKDCHRMHEMIGDTPRSIRPTEEYGRVKLRRSPYTKRDVKANELLDPRDIVFMRPSESTAFAIDDILSAESVRATSDIPAGTPISPEKFVLKKF